VPTTAPTTDVVIFSRGDLDLVAAFAGCSLDEKPGSNWVQDAGGLPDYICRIARAIKRKGRTTGQAISIAVSRVKKWSTGVGVDSDTQVKATAALAEWEKLKAKAHAKKMVSASSGRHDMLYLANTTVEYNVDIVRSAFEQRAREARHAWRAANPNAEYDACPVPYTWVKEQWTSFLIVQSDRGKNPELYKVPYEVDADNNVNFGDPVEVKTEYVVVAESDLTGADLTDADLQALLGMSAPAAHSLDKFLGLAPPRSGLDRIVELARAVSLSAEGS
jgi:hypothetical protein